jgi:hypothetical protein
VAVAVWQWQWHIGSWCGIGSGWVAVKNVTSTKKKTQSNEQIYQK